VLAADDSVLAVGGDAIIATPAAHEMPDSIQQDVVAIGAVQVVGPGPRIEPVVAGAGGQSVEP
jgi:hypothetical protein